MVKIQISINNNPMSGYTYVSPSLGQDIYNLDNIICDNECTEIFAEDIMDYIPLPRMLDAVSHWVKKLRRNGKLIIGGTDIYEVAKRIMRMELSTTDSNKLLFGEQDTVWGIKRGQITAKDLCDLVQQLNLKITKKALNDTTMVVEAIRE